MRPGFCTGCGWPLVVFFLERRLDDAAPPTQNMIVESRRQAMAAHMKPKLYLPRLALRPSERKWFRPWTYAALNVGFG